MWPALHSDGGMAGTGPFLRWLCLARSSANGGSTAHCCRHSCAYVVHATAVAAMGAGCVRQRSTSGCLLGPSSSMSLVWRRHVWCLLQHRGGASGCVGLLLMVVLQRWRGDGSFLDHERAAGVVQSGESLHQIVGMMAAPLGCRSLSGFSTVGSKFVSIVRRARMVSTGDNEI
jgi:hypothetical protein